MSDLCLVNLADIQILVKAAHSHDIKVIIDISYQIGAIKVNLHDWNIDAAYFSTDKYLCTGKEGVTGVFVHETQKPLFQNTVSQEGEDSNKGKYYDTLSRFRQTSYNPLHLVRLNSRLDTYLQAGNINVWGKNKNMFMYLVHLIGSIQGAVEVVNKTNENCGHVALRVVGEGKSATDLVKALSAQNMVCDY